MKQRSPLISSKRREVCTLLQLSAEAQDLSSYAIYLERLKERTIVEIPSLYIYIVYIYIFDDKLLTLNTVCTNGKNYQQFEHHFGILITYILTYKFL